MRSEQEIIANKGLIKGFLQPIFYDEYGRFSALSPQGFEKVRDGYACAKCLCEYTTYLVKCPVCGHERDLAADLEDARADHVAHLREEQRTEGMDTGAPRGFEEFMAEVNASKEIEHTTLSKLKKRRRG